jgi:hypothetical protein
MVGGHVLSKCPKASIHPPGTLNFNMFSGGDSLSLGHLLRTWRTGKILETFIWYLLCDYVMRSKFRILMPMQNSYCNHRNFNSVNCIPGFDSITVRL